MSYCDIWNKNDTKHITLAQLHTRAQPMSFDFAVEHYSSEVFCGRRNHSQKGPCLQQRLTSFLQRHKHRVINERLVDLNVSPKVTLIAYCLDVDKDDEKVLFSHTQELNIKSPPIDKAKNKIEDIFNQRVRIFSEINNPNCFNITFNDELTKSKFCTLYSINFINQYHRTKKGICKIHPADNDSVLVDREGIQNIPSLP